jgi:hypothetical protein
MLSVLTPAWCPAPGLRRPPASSNLPSGAARGGSFSGRWIHAIKFDGYRAQAHLRNDLHADGSDATYSMTAALNPGREPSGGHR